LSAYAKITSYNIYRKRKINKRNLYKADDLILIRTKIIRPHHNPRLRLREIKYSKKRSLILKKMCGEFWAALNILHFKSR